MSAPTFGMTFTRPETEPVPVLGADFSKALLIETSADATAEIYPIDTPVRISTSDPIAVAGLGTGLLADAVKGINDQLTTGADVIVVRVTEGGTVAETVASIVAVLEDVAAIPPAVGATPRLVWAGRTAAQLVDAEEAPIANPVLTALPAACEKLLAIAVVDLDDTSTAITLAQREEINSPRVLPVGIAAKVLVDDVAVTRPMGPRVLGLFMREDFGRGGLPFDPIANRVVNGLVGLSRDLPFSLLDGSTEGQQLLEGNVSIVTRGERGVDAAVADGGFVFIGTDGAGTGELWRQIHQVRGADYLTVKIMAITRSFLGRRISGDLVEAWLNSLKFMLRDHKAANDILGYDVQFIADQNSPEQIRLGRLKVDLAVEPAPAFRLAQHDVRRYRPAVEGLVADIVARLSSAA